MLIFLKSFEKNLEVALMVKLDLMKIQQRIC